MENLNATILAEKLDRFLNVSTCAFKVTPAFGFPLKKKRRSRIQKFYADGNNNMLDRFKCVWTKDDLANLEAIFHKTDVIESCSFEKSNTKWMFHEVQVDLTVSAALLKDVHLGCKDVVLPESLLKNHASTVSLLKSKHDSHIRTICAFFLFLLSLCMEMKSWKKKHLKISNYS